MIVRDNYRLCIVVERTALDGWCIHKIIMPSSRTEIESECADFFHKTG